MKKRVLMMLLSLVISASAVAAPAAAAEQPTGSGTETVVDTENEKEETEEQEPAEDAAADTAAEADTGIQEDVGSVQEPAEDEPEETPNADSIIVTEGPSDANAGEPAADADGSEEKTEEAVEADVEPDDAEESVEDAIIEDAQQSAENEGKAASGAAAKTGLVKSGSHTVYYSGGKTVKNQWKTVSGKRYYFGSDGYAKTGWFNIGEKLFYAMPDGVVRSGFAEIGGKRYYLPADGNTRTGWQTINKKTYYLGKKGLVTTGFRKINNKTYYFMDGRCVGFKSADTGVRMTGFRTIDGKKYYFFSKDCAGYTSANRYSMATGWQTIDEARYHFSSSGVMDTGWKTIGGRKYYFTKSGKTCSGKTKIGSRYYWLSKSGYLVPVNDFITIGGKTYFVDGNGMFPSGAKQINGKVYCLAADGEVRRNGLKQAGKYYYVADKNGACKSGLFYYGKHLYMADTKTCRVDMNFIGDASEMKALSTGDRKIAEKIIKVIYAKYMTVDRDKVSWKKSSYRIPLGTKVTRSRMDRILNTIGTTYSKALWGYVNFDYSISKDNVLTMKDSQIDSLSGAAEIYRMSAIYSFAKIGVEKCVKSGMTTEQKVRAIDEYLCKRFTYRHEFDARRKDSQHGIRYALESGYAGTEYATFFYAMCDEAGIECERLTGEIKKTTIKGLSTDKMQPYGNIWYKDTAPHAWNRVRIDGKWYYVDSAANDSGSGSSGKYMMSKSEWKDHIDGTYNFVLEDYESVFGDYGTDPSRIHYEP